MTVMQLSLLQHLWQRYKKVVSKIATQQTEPLLDAATLEDLRHRAQSIFEPQFLPRKLSTHRLIGEQLSRFRGQGFEFEENRIYQAGDEPRLINWRLYARTAELYTKVFNEERRPEVYLVTDRRASMRFGTRKQLKAALAAKMSASAFFQAQRQALAVGGIIINETLDWFAPTAAGSLSQDYIHSLALPCPPLAFDNPQPDLNSVFSLLLERVPHGSIILLVSDFSDLYENSVSLLHQLNQQCDVEAVLIRDPAESRINAHGVLLLDDPGSDRPLRIDTSQKQLLSQFEQAVAKRNAEVTEIFQMSGIALTSCSTGDGIDVCLESSHARN